MPTERRTTVVQQIGPGVTHEALARLVTVLAEEVCHSIYSQPFSYRFNGSMHSPEDMESQEKIVADWHRLMKKCRENGAVITVSVQSIADPALVGAKPVPS